MKRKLLKSLLAVAMLCVGVGNVWAQDPTPVYFNDFSSTEGLTIQGTGSFTDDGDTRFGQVFSNAASASPRSNYLLLPSTVFSDFTDDGGKTAMTISFWVTAKNAGAANAYTYAPLFAAYSAAPNPTNGLPMICLPSRGTMQINNNGWCDFAPAQNKDGKNTIYNTNAWEVDGSHTSEYTSGGNWLDDSNWHLYTMTLTASQATIYLDGVLKNQWNLNGGDGQYVSGMFTKSATNLTYVCLGGNQAWDWGDNDAAFMFDDFAVYDVALTPAQIEKIIDTKLGRTTIYERTLTGATAWSSSDAAASGSDLNVWYGNMGYNETYGIYGNANGNRSSVMTFSHTTNSIQTFDIVFNNLGNTGDGGNYSYIKIGSDIEIQSNQQNQNGFVIINGNSTGISDCNQKNYNRGGDSWTIHVEINTAEKKVTAFNLVGTTMNGKSAHYTMTSETALSSSATFNTVTVGFVRAKGNPATALTSIKIKEQAQAVTNVDYTINYKLGDDLVKSVTDEGVVDQVITADAAIDGTEAGYENHYLIIAAEAPSMTLVNGENILNVPVRAPYAATLTVTKNINGEAQTPEVTNLVETDEKVCSWSYAYPMYVQKDGVYYIADETSSFGEFGNFTNGQSISKTVNYTTATPEVVWFKDIDGATVFNVAYSGGGYTNTNVQLANVTVDAGIYEVIFNVVSKAGSGSNHRNEGVSVNGENVANLTGNVNGIRSLTITVANDESVITAYGNGTSNYTDNLDYVIIKKLPSTVPVTLGSLGWATLYTPYALDFDGTGLTAYTASVEGSTVTLTPVTDVPANTGVVLNGAEGSYNIPTTASSETAKGDLTGDAAAATASDAFDGYTLFALAQAEDPAHKVQFRPVSSGSIAAGKAFLKIASGAGIKAFTVNFGDAVAISDVSSKMEDGQSEIFNLAGQRMSKVQKGVNIVNGKKVLVK